jgi:hypothetical protein
MTKAELMQRLQEIANAEFDGHFTVMKFTTNWRVCFGTPLEPYNYEPIAETLGMCAGETFEEAAMAAIETRRRAVYVTWRDVGALNRQWEAFKQECEAATDEEIAAEEMQRLYSR